MIYRFLVLSAFLLFFSHIIYDFTNVKELPEGFSGRWARTDFSRKSIAFSEIAEASLNLDEIQPLDKPLFIETKYVNHLDKNEAVVSFSLFGDYRVYPLKILRKHIVVNDLVGNVSVAVTYSPTSNSVMVYKTELEGRRLHLAATGKLRHGNFLLYDKETYSWWQQFTGEALIGNLLAKKLELVPARLESFAKFKERVKNSKILLGQKDIDYDNNPYKSYESLRRPFAFNKLYQGKIKELAYVVMVGNKAWPLAKLKQKKRIIYNDYRIIWSPGMNSVLSDEGVSNDLGNVVVQKKDAQNRYYDAPYLLTFAFAFTSFVRDGEILY